MGHQQTYFHLAIVAFRSALYRKSKYSFRTGVDGLHGMAWGWGGAVLSRARGHCEGSREVEGVGGAS